MPVPPSRQKTPPDPAAEIARLHGRILAGLRRSLADAFQIGRLLEGHKAGLKHGDWGVWVEANLPFDEKTAWNYRRLYRERERLKSESVSDLAEAYAFLRNPRPQPPAVARFEDAPDPPPEVPAFTLSPEELPWWEERVEFLTERIPDLAEPAEGVDYRKATVLRVVADRYEQEVARHAR